MTAVQTPSYSTHQTAVLAGVTFRQLDHWSRRGVLGEMDTPGSGRRRRFNDDDVRLFRVLGRVSSMAMSLFGTIHAGSTELYAEIASVLRANPDAVWLVVSADGVSAENELDPAGLPSEAFVCRLGV